MGATAVRERQELVDNKRWGAYAAAAAASALVCQGAEANIIHVTVNQVLDASGGPGTTFGSLNFAIGAASSASLTFGHLANTSSGAAFFGVGGAGGMFAGFQAAGYPYAFNLASGQNVSTAGGFLSGTGTLAFVSGFGNSQFLNPGIGFVGFQFNGGGGSQYGWARLDMSGAPVNSFEVVDYAYGDIGEAVAVGQTSSQVPAPGGLGLLAAGAAGLALARRRRRQKQA